MTKSGLPLTVIAVAATNLFGCGGGCDGMTPIPGGFPAAERTANAGQVRVSQTGLAAITADPGAIIGGLLGSGGALTFDVPENCGGSPSTCCPGGNPVSPCGPIEIDLEQQPGDQPRLVLTPVQGQGRLDITIRARVRTAMDVPVGVPIVGDCGLHIDTEDAGADDLIMQIPVNFVQDGQAGTTRVVVGDATITQLDNGDVALTGSFGCQFASLGIGFFIDTLVQTFEDAIAGAVGDQLCKTCETGDVAECGAFATACTDNVCMKADDTCVQELGLTGRMAASALFSSLSPGTTGSIDLYEVAGGYATTNSNGLALGLLGGMLPAGAERDRCGPPGVAPPAVTIPESTYFQGNTRPDNGQAFDIGIGVHESQLDDFAYAAYDGGFLCLTLTTASVDLLTTDTISLVASSLGDLVEDPSPVAIGLRPQSQPTIVLGTNTFVDDGAGGTMLGDPLLAIHFSAMELDFFAAIEDQYVRLFTVVADVDLPIGLQVDENGELLPVLGDIDDAFTNISVKNSEALRESPEDLAAVFPTLLGFALPQLTGALGGFALPEIAGLRIDVTDITAVDNVAFLAIYGELTPASMAAPAPLEDRVATSATITSIEEPDLEVAADPAQWTKANRPRVALELGGDQPGLEWSTRVDDGVWSAWSAASRVTLSPRSFWLPGTHTIEVRARRAGEARSADLTPVEIKLPLGDALVRAPEARGAARSGSRDFHGQASESGCGCASSRGSAGTGLMLMIAGVLVLRRRRASKRGLAAAAIVAAGALTGPGCNCGGDPAPCGDVECMEGEVERGAIGRWNDVATDGTRTVVSTYDRGLGDLVLIDVAGEEPVYTAIDGLPPDVEPTFDPSTYRGGVVGPGPDVGAWTSVALHDGRARIAYQDRDAEDLRFAYEGTDGAWHAYQVEGDADVAIGRYASLTIDGSGNPAIAYMAIGIQAGGGVYTNELRLARASSATPGENDWTISTLASAPASCGGLCPSGEVCVVAEVTGDPAACTTESGDCGAEGCGDGSVCIAGVCREEVPEPSVVGLPGGAGLFADALTLSDGRLAVVHYDMVRTALVLLVENGGTFGETILDGEDGSDRGMWATAVADGTTIHVAYQDALGDQVFYTSWNGSPGAIELVDDGVREGDRPHQVGAGAALFLEGGAPAVAYQDGLAGDLVLSRSTGGGTWSRSNVATGAALDGFHTAGVAGTLVWERIDANAAPLGELIIEAP